MPSFTGYLHLISWPLHCVNSACRQSQKEKVEEAVKSMDVMIVSRRYLKMMPPWLFALEPHDDVGLLFRD